MAQILKENIRQDILAAAKHHFIIHGIDDASMRNIATSANMTVGNVYRYYRNKEALADAILNPTMQRINQAIFDDLDHPDEDMLKTRQQRMDFFLKKINSMSDGFLDVFATDQQECLILLKHQRFTDQLVSWINELIETMIRPWAKQDPTLAYVPQLSDMLSEAIVSGLARGMLITLKPYHQHPEKLKAIINMYLHLFTMMLEAGDQYD